MDNYANTIGDFLIRLFEIIWGAVNALFFLLHLSFVAETSVSISAPSYGFILFLFLMDLLLCTSFMLFISSNLLRYFRAAVLGANMFCFMFCCYAFFYPPSSNLFEDTLANTLMKLLFIVIGVFYFMNVLLLARKLKCAPHEKSQKI